MASLEAGLCRKRQALNNETEEGLRVFFRPFLNISEGMDADLGFSVNS